MTCQTIMMWSGRRVAPLRLKPEDIDILDIAHHLSTEPRFMGATREPIYVAGHSVRVSLACPEWCALWGLLHDASEAYLRDLPRPLKSSPLLLEYRRAELRVMMAVTEKFDLPWSEPLEVKQADIRIGMAEARDWMPEGFELGPQKPVYACDMDLSLQGLTPHPDPIILVDHKAAAWWFLDRFEELTK